MIERTYIKTLVLLFVFCLCLAGCNTPEPATSVDTPGPLLVRLETTKGDIVIELDRKAAPITVSNFVQYVNEGFYDGTIFHRVIAGFMIQGGGILPDMSGKATRAPIKNEASNGLKNVRGTITMARSDMPHSATSQFFINHGNNALLDYGSPRDPNGYAVFGKVVRGMDVVDAIAEGATVFRGREKSLPVKPVLVKKATVISGQ
jgi:cyclophilin family peptidyl-prolyl cis-trans isomerase